MKNDWVKENQLKIIGAQNSEREEPSIIKAHSTEQIGRLGKKKTRTQKSINPETPPANDPDRQPLQKNAVP